MKNKRVLTILFFIFIFGLTLRIFFLRQNALSFYYDTARDAFISQSILTGDLKVQGPPSSTPGLFHGVFYYYLLAPAYFIGNGSPITAAIWIALLNSLTIFVVYYLTLLLTRKTGTSLLSAFLFSFSFILTQYAGWVSNPTVAILTVPLIYVGLWTWIVERKSWGAVLCAVALGLSIHFEVFLAYQILPVAFWLLVERKKIIRGDILKFVLVLSLVLIPFLISEMKFGFRGVSGAASLFMGGDVFVKMRGFGDFVILYLNQMGRMFTTTIFPVNSGYGGFFGVAAIVYLFKNWNKPKGKFAISKESFLLSYVFSHASVVSLGGTSTPFVTVGLESSIVILSAIFLAFIFERKKILALFLLLLLLIGNMSTIFKENPHGQTVFAIQKNMVLSKQLALIDYTYKEAGGQKFSINSLTSPLWINTVWSYLYNWYGKGKYGYLPEWRGRDQIDLLGNNLPNPSDSTTLHFFITEPTQGIPERYLLSETNIEDARSIIVEEKRFEDLRVEKRTIIKN